MAKSNLTIYELPDAIYDLHQVKALVRGAVSLLKQHPGYDAADELTDSMLLLEQVRSHLDRVIDGLDEIDTAEHLPRGVQPLVA
jgi:hypothetical protein